MAVLERLGQRFRKRAPNRRMTPWIAFRFGLEVLFPGLGRLFAVWSNGIDVLGKDELTEVFGACHSNSNVTISCVHEYMVLNRIVASVISIRPPPT